MQLSLVIAVMFYIGASVILVTCSPFAHKKTPMIVFTTVEFTTAYGWTAATIWAAGYTWIGIIAFFVGIIMLTRRMFLDAMKL